MSVLKDDKVIGIYNEIEDIFITKNKIIENGAIVSSNGNLDKSWMDIYIEVVNSCISSFLNIDCNHVDFYTVLSMLAKENKYREGLISLSQKVSMLVGDKWSSLCCSLFDDLKNLYVNSYLNDDSMSNRNCLLFSKFIKKINEKFSFDYNNMSYELCLEKSGLPIEYQSVGPMMNMFISGLVFAFDKKKYLQYNDKLCAKSMFSNIFLIDIIDDIKSYNVASIDNDICNLLRDEIIEFQKKVKKSNNIDDFEWLDKKSEGSTKASSHEDEIDNLIKVSNHEDEIISISKLNIKVDVNCVVEVENDGAKYFFIFIFCLFLLTLVFPEEEDEIEEED